MRPKPASISLNYIFLLEKQESYNFKLVAKRKCLLLMQFFLCSKLFSKLETSDDLHKRRYFLFADSTKL